MTEKPGENPGLREQIRQNLEQELSLDSLTDSLEQEAIEKGLVDPIIVRTNNPQWPFTVIERPQAGQTIPIRGPMWLPPMPGLEAQPKPTDTKSTFPIRGPEQIPPTPGLER